MDSLESSEECVLSVSSNNMTIDGKKHKFSTGTWNFVNAPVSTNLQASLAHDPTNAHGCVPFKSSFAGKFLAIKRGVCFFGAKVLYAQAAGAIAIVVLDNVV